MSLIDRLNPFRAVENVVRGAQFTVKTIGAVVDSAGDALVGEERVGEKLKDKLSEAYQEWEE